MPNTAAENEQHQKPQDLVAQIVALQEAGDGMGALNAAIAGIQTYPNNKRLARLGIELTDTHGDIEQKCQAYGHGVRLFGSAARAGWVTDLAEHIRSEFGDARSTTRPDEHAALVKELVALAGIIWPNWGQPIEGAEPISDNRTIKLARFSRYMIDFHSLRFEPAEAQSWERVLFALPDELQMPRDFELARLLRMNLGTTEDGLSEEELAAQADRLFLDTTDGKETDPEKAKFHRFGTAVERARRGDPEELSAFLDQMEDGPRARAFQHNFGAFANLAGPRALIEDTQSPWGHDIDEGDLFIAKSASPTTGAIILFMSLGTFPDLFSSAMHPILVKTGLHLIYVRNGLMQYHLSGREWDTPAELNEKLSGLLADLGVTDIYTIGASAGAGTALRVGKQIGAKGVVAFSPVVVDKDAKFERTGRLFREAEERDPEHELDIRRLYRTDEDANPNVHVLVGDSCEGDLVHTALLDGMKNIKIEYLPGLADHASARHVLSLGRMPATVDAMLNAN